MVLKWGLDGQLEMLRNAQEFDPSKDWASKTESLLKWFLSKNIKMPYDAELFFDGKCITSTVSIISRKGICSESNWQLNHLETPIYKAKSHNHDSEWLVIRQRTGISS